MEKFSAYRDPGTGIQPFLRPIPPQESKSSVSIALAPFLFALASFRTILVLCLTVIYILLTNVVLLLLIPLGPLHRVTVRFLSAGIARLVLFIVGVYWIPVEVVKRRKGRIASKEPWRPGPGDLILSNWASWLEILWLVVKCDPVFVVPVSGPIPLRESSPPVSPRATPGRKTGTGSAAITATPVRAPNERARIIGFEIQSVLQMISWTGHVPSVAITKDTSNLKSLEELRSKAKAAGRPLAIFPECTTSNGRGLLRFGDVLNSLSITSLKFRVHIMCARIDPPTAFAPTLSHAIPSKFFNPLSHLFSMATSPLPRTLSIRLLASSDSPGSPSFPADDFPSATGHNPDSLSSICATLMGDIGRMKQVGLGWEDKSMFLELFKSKRS